jgi:PIN domain nuclease of toxin-antitoxin system
LRRGDFAVSAISFREIARLAQRQRVVLRLPAEAWRRDLLGSGLREVAIDGRTGIRAAELERLHRDPADRFIVASAPELGAQLLTADQKILDCQATFCARTPENNGHVGDAAVPERGGVTDWRH